jgi:hypothetical protein
MNRSFFLLPLLLLLAGCACKPRLVPQAYMPVPPTILMQPPKELYTIIPQSISAPEEVPESD